MELTTQEDSETDVVKLSLVGACLIALSIASLLIYNGSTVKTPSSMVQNIPSNSTEAVSVATTTSWQNHFTITCVSP